MIFTTQLSWWKPTEAKVGHTQLWQFAKTICNLVA